MKRTFASVTVLVIVLAFPFMTAVAGTDCPVKYTVQQGDRLYRIALKYGIKWPAIVAANNLPNPDYIQVGQVLCIPVTPTPAAPALTKTATPVGSPAPTSTPIPTVSFVVPTFTITAVTRDQAVTIKAINFPRSTKFDVLMGPRHTQGVNGTLVATTDSGTGSFTATYNIPASLRGSAQISIRLQSKSGYFSYNWFYNVTTR
ncbi:MAG TPA: LysM peptidoglycan-binding domain-containing protein [Anaerolineales bacterium]|nr:LysM peptidoglycan-binding domain-containing protein [Anaerolineales bacterium]